MSDDFLKPFREIQQKFPRLFSRLLSQKDLTLPQYALLNLLRDSGSMPMTEASTKLHITKPAVTNLVDQLERKKYLERCEHARDRRVYLLAIKPLGEKTVRQIQSHILGFLLKTLNQFTAGEKMIINRFYTLLGRTLEDVLSGMK